MPAKDIYHTAVKYAPIEDWLDASTHDPLRLEWGGKDMYVDLGAERARWPPKEAEETDEAMVEVKSFVGECRTWMIWRRLWAEYVL